MNIWTTAIHDAIAANEVTISHIQGKSNLEDLLTKEHKDDNHFVALRGAIVLPPPSMGCVRKLGAKEEIDAIATVVGKDVGCTDRPS